MIRFFKKNSSKQQKSYFCGEFSTPIFFSEMMQNDNNDIIQGIVAGQSAAFKELYRLYYVSLCRFAFKYMGDVQQSEDLVQDTLLKIWEQRAKLTSLSNLKSYLFASVKNTCLNSLEHKKVISKHAEHVAIEINVLSLQCDNTDLATEQELLEDKLLGAINELPAQCQLVFKMKYLEGLRTKDIASKTNLSPRTVEAHVFNALKTLRAKFNGVLPLIFFGIMFFTFKIFR